MSKRTYFTVTEDGDEFMFGEPAKAEIKFGELVKEGKYTHLVVRQGDTSVLLKEGIPAEVAMA